jgi:hypothetical protein
MNSSRRKFITFNRVIAISLLLLLSTTLAIDLWNHEARTKKETKDLAALLSERSERNHMNWTNTRQARPVRDCAHIGQLLPPLALSEFEIQPKAIQKGEKTECSVSKKSLFRTHLERFVVVGV